MIRLFYTQRKKQNKSNTKDIVMTCTSFYSLPLDNFTNLFCFANDNQYKQNNELLSIQLLRCMLHIESKVLNRIQ